MSSGSAASQPILYVVLEHSRKQHTQLPLIEQAKILAAQGTMVYDWRPDRNLKHKAQEVRVYAVPVPAFSRRASSPANRTLSGQRSPVSQSFH